MTGDWMAAIPAALGAWSVRLLDVSWQAGLLVAVAWAACRLFPRMPAHVRATVWWLVCAKFLIGLAWIEPLALPVLPPESVQSIATAAAPASGAGSSSASATSVAAPNATRVATADSGDSAIATSVPLALGGIWICGALLQLALTCLAWRRTRALVRTSTPAEASIALLARELSERIGIGRVDVRMSAAIDTPRVTGAFSPIILLPIATDRLSPTDLEMTLCHELLHVRRGDLLLGWLPSLAQCMFFFHPCMWIASREYALAREAACDAAVLRLLDAAPDAYGALLLRLGIAHTDIAPVAVGASSSFRTLKRRLIMLQQTSEKARAHAARWWILAAAAALLIIPLRLVAQSPAPAPASAAAPTPKSIEPRREIDPWAALKSDAWHAAQRMYEGTKDAWVLLRDGDDENVTMDGSTGDVSIARKQRERNGEPLLWFRHNGKSYVIRDPETLRTVRELFAPMEKLGAQQGDFGESQGKLGEQQGKLGAEQGMLGDEMSKLAARLNLLNADQLELTAKELRGGERVAEELKAQHAQVEKEMRRLSEQMEALGRRQEELGRQQEALGREQEKWGRQQEAIGRQQEEVARRAERQLREILERAIATGVAKPAR
jgi:bla regulator protein blaR1